MVSVRTSSLIAASVALLSSYVNAYGQIAQVVDANNFCVFLPPNDSKDRIIADTEWNAQAFCIGNTPKAKNAGKLDSDFIQSAHYLKTDQYVQVTGQINPAKAKLIASDEGGQMDVRAPMGSSCAGWKYYVNLIEPAGNTYCMRCCNDDRTCNRGISEKGCAHIIPGDYSGPYGDNGSSSSGSADTTTKAATTTTKTKTKTKTTTTEKASKTSSSTKSASATKAGAVDASKATEGSNASKATEGSGASDASKATAGNGSSDNASSGNASSGTSGDDSANANGGAQDATSTTPAAANDKPALATSSGGSPTATTDGASGTVTPPTTEMLSQNDKVSEQSVNGADQFQPTLMTLAAVMVTMAMMMLQ
ncbi:secreted protein [Mucor ambiguus]|uniref:Secreted protein n=1 Tax=Mucor ambiguus TaxID=91626 RepID=A0A0C9ML73_9FUNG|nr:secreted protein [Mucor ambiguus]